METRSEIVRYQNDSFLVKKSRLEALQLIFNFLEVYNDVFFSEARNGSTGSYNSENNDDLILSNCIKKFRGAYRKQYKVVFYLSSVALNKTYKKAYKDAMKTLEAKQENVTKAKLEKLLNDKFTQEKVWIKHTNEMRRESVLNDLKRETLSEFKAKVEQEFSVLFNESQHNVAAESEMSTLFYEEDALSETLEEMERAFTADFKKEIPFIEEEDPLIVSKLEEEVAAMLSEKVSAVLTKENAMLKSKVEELMSKMLKESIFKYTEKLTETANKRLTLEKDKFLMEHRMLKDQFLPQFENYGNQKCRQEFMETYNDEIYSALDSILDKHNTIVKNKLEEAYIDSIAEVQKCLDKISTIFLTAGISQEHLSEFERTINEKLDDTINSLMKFSEINSDCIFSAATQNEKYLNEQKAEQIHKIMADLKKDFLETINAHVKAEQIDNLSKLNLDFQSYFAEKKSQMCKQLKMEVQEKVGKDENLDEAEKNLTNFADALFSTLTQQNDEAENGSFDTDVRKDIIVRKATIGIRPPPICSSPPLVIQISTVAIRMAMMISGQLEILKNEFGQKYTRTKVGLTKHSKLIYGTDLSNQLKSSKSEECLLTKSWDLFTQCRILDLNAWREEISETRHRDKITYELLLGFLLRKLKETAERTQGKTIGTSVISIPYWFSSAQRIRVKDAAALAGFKNMTLVNDGAAAAYCCLKSVSSKYMDKILVLSYNGTTSVDIFLYQVMCTADDNQNELRMQGYRKANLLHVEGVNKQDTLTVVRRECKEIAKTNLKSGDTVHLLVAWEFENWSRAKILKDIGREMVGAQVVFAHANLAVVQGAVLLAHCIKTGVNPVADKVNFDICQENPISPFEHTKLLTRSTFLPMHGCTEAFSATFRTSSSLTGAYFFQGLWFGEHKIGKLNVQTGNNNTDDVCVYFKINSQNIVSVERATAMKNGVEVATLQKGGVSWQSPNLSREELQQQKMLLHLISKSD